MFKDKVREITLEIWHPRCGETGFGNALILKKLYDPTFPKGTIS
jgi:hypothetical protein